MAIKNDKWIEMMSKEHSMIKPFQSDQVRKGIISYG